MLNFTVSSSSFASDLVIATHNGIFHADDCMAVAILLRASERDGAQSAHIVRTRRPEVLAQAHIRVDVGGEYSTQANTFDHHQKGGAGARWDSEVPYAAAGLVWHQYGPKLVVSEKEFALIDEELIAPIDAIDCGHAKPAENSFSFSGFISSLNPGWTEDSSEAASNAAFEGAVRICYEALNRAIVRASGMAEAEQIVKAADDGSPIMVLPKFCPWQRPVFELGLEHIQYCVFPAETGDYRVQAVPTAPTEFTMRRPLPEAWAGLRGADLAAATGVADSIFCHPGKFIAGATTREGCLAMAAQALK